MKNDINTTELFCEYYRQWIDVYKKGAIREATMAKYLMTQKWVERLVPELKVSELTRTAYQKLLNDYAKEHERQTTLDFHHQLKGAILDAVDEGLIKRDPTRKAIIKGKTPRVKKIKYLNQFELHTLIAHLNLGETVNWDWFILLVAKTGMRFSEALAITPGDFDFARQTLSISKTWDYKGEGGFLPTKNKSSVRKIQIDWQIVVKFSELMKNLPEDKPIFVGDTKIYNSTVNDVLTRHCKECGISEISIHGLRHTHASLLLFAGVSIASVARRLGHASMTTSGRFHTDWLNMLFPRLRIARDLLCEDGLIMISMDENESTNLKKMCDEVFGESNYIGEIIRKTKSMTADNGNGFNTQHEILVLYAKNKPLVVLHGEEKEFSNYSNPDDDPNGDWCPGDPSAKSGGATTSFGIENPYTHRIDYPPSGRYWAFSKTTLKKYIATGKIKFKTAYGEKERGFIFKRYKKDATSYYDPVHSLFATENEYMNQAATIEIKKLFGDNVFSYPKPVSFLKKLIQYATDEEDIVLDFFSGSATTAQAIIELNQEEETNRKFIMVQIPEALEESSIAYKQGFQTLCEIGCARIDKVLSESDSKEGYRYFKLDSSNMKEVFYRPSEVEQGSFGLYVDNIKEDRSSEDLLFQVMLEMGILLSSQMKETEIAGKKVYSVADDFLIACFDNDVTEETVKAVAEKKPHYAVFRDSSMANDSVASNFDQIFASVSPKTVRKVL